MLPRPGLDCTMTEIAQEQSNPHLLNSLRWSKCRTSKSTGSTGVLPGDTATVIQVFSGVNDLAAGEDQHLLALPEMRRGAVPINARGAALPIHRRHIQQEVTMVVFPFGD